jgi:urease accessory protein UreE
MILIEQIPAPAHESLAGKRRDTLRLTWEARRWARQRLQTTGGRDVALALPTGTVMPLGAVLWIGHDWYLEVEGAPEPVLLVKPRGHEEAIRVAFEVGNRHFSVALHEGTLLVPDDTAMSQLLDRLGMAWERVEAVYTPLGFGQGHTHLTGISHSHTQDSVHSHEHPHEHDHEQEHQRETRRPAKQEEPHGHVH